MRNKADCRTTPATPGLLNMKQVEEEKYKKDLLQSWSRSRVKSMIIVFGSEMRTELANEVAGNKIRKRVT